MGRVVAMLDDGGRGDRGRRSRTLRRHPQIEGVRGLEGWAPIGVSSVHGSDGCDGIGLDGRVGEWPLEGSAVGGGREGERGTLLRPLTAGVVRIFLHPPGGLRGRGVAARAVGGEGAVQGAGAGGEVPEPSGDARREGRTERELQETRRK